MKLTAAILNLRTNGMNKKGVNMKQAIGNLIFDTDTATALARGVLTFILFLVGGIVILMQKKEQPVAPPVAGQNAG